LDLFVVDVHSLSSSSSATVKATPSSVVPTLSLQECLQAGQQLHKEECDFGFQTYGRTSSSSKEDEDEATAASSLGSEKKHSSFSDDDFVEHSIPYPGPDDTLKVQSVFQSKAPLVSEQDCAELIQEARDKIAADLLNDQQLQQQQQQQQGGDITQQQQQQQQPTNSQLGEARVSTLPKGRDWLQKNAHSTLFPLLQDRFGVDATHLTLHDALIIGYGYFGDGGSRSQPIHRDSSLLSLNIALSEESSYSGGGTYFEGLGKTLHQARGHITCHPGGIMHAGHGITKGERWVMVLFVIDETVPQLARRCHQLGMMSSSSSSSSSSLWKEYFSAALSVTPRNHLIHKDFGRCYAQEEGDMRSARQFLSRTVQYYPLDVEATIALARMFLDTRQPRAALRRLDKLLSLKEVLPDEDMLRPDVPVAWQPRRAQGWEARVMAATCALQCMNRSTKYLPKAMERLETCLQAAPSPQLENMLAAARHALASE